MLKCEKSILWKRNNFGTMIFGFRLYQTLSHDYSQWTRDLWLDSLQLCNDGLNFGLISKIFISRFLFTQNHEGVHTYILGSWRTDDVTHKNQLWIFVRKWRPSVYKIRIFLPIFCEFSMQPNRRPWRTSNFRIAIFKDKASSINKKYYI